MNLWYFCNNCIFIQFLENSMWGMVTIAVTGALGFAFINFYAVKRRDSGTPQMQEIAQAIQEGADAFIRHEYRIIAAIAFVIALLLGILVSWYTGVAFLLGAVMSGSAGWVGMKIATIANVRVSNTARLTLSMGGDSPCRFSRGKRNGPFGGRLCPVRFGSSVWSIRIYVRASDRSS